MVLRAARRLPVTGLWPGTPYAHAMIPVGGGPAHATAATPAPDKKEMKEMK